MFDRQDQCRYCLIKNRAVLQCQFWSQVFGKWINLPYVTEFCFFKIKSHLLSFVWCWNIAKFVSIIRFMCDVHCMLVTDFFSVAIVFYNFFKVWVRIQTNLYKYTKFTYFFLVNIKCLDYWFMIYVNIPVKGTINKDPKKNMYLILDTINMTVKN